MVINWISIEEELPHDMQDVLLFDRKGEEYIGYYYASNGRFIRYIDGLNIEDVTHWMPLPSAPKI
jgi:hypothetical protein